MFRLLLPVALFFAVTAIATPSMPEVAVDKSIKADTQIVGSTASRDFLPRVDEPSDLHGCYCTHQGLHCSPILAAASGTCKANIFRGHQTEQCILRCARFCFYDSPSKPLCQALHEWLDQKLHKIFRASHFPEEEQHH